MWCKYKNDEWLWIKQLWAVDMRPYHQCSLVKGRWNAWNQFAIAAHPGSYFVAYKHPREHGKPSIQDGGSVELSAAVSLKHFVCRNFFAIIFSLLSILTCWAFLLLYIYRYFFKIVYLYLFVLRTDSSLSKFCLPSLNRQGLGVFKILSWRTYQDLAS